MERLTTAVSAAFVGVAAVVFAAVPAGAQGTGVSALRPGARQVRAERLQASTVAGTISGSVMDEAGGALRGAMVSAVGVTLASTVTDERGQFTLNQLPPGEYLLRAHLLGFAASTGLMVRVGGATPFQRVQLRRLDDAVSAVATTGTVTPPVTARPIIAAGFDLPRGTRDDRVHRRGESSARRSRVAAAASQAQHPQRGVADPRPHRRPGVRPDHVAVRPCGRLGCEHRLVVLHRFPVLRRGQFPDDRRARAGRDAVHRRRCRAEWRIWRSPLPGRAGSGRSARR